MTPEKRFQSERRDQIDAIGRDEAFREATRSWLGRSIERRYSYSFDWLGRPIIQYPQDVVAFQELVWTTRPDVIVETGIAHGGSLMLSASLLAMLDYADAAEAGETLDPAHPKRRVVAVDIDIRAHNRAAIEAHPMASRITMIEGSSIDTDVVARVRETVAGVGAVLLSLDSNHTHDHVLAELDAYAPLVSMGSYACVFDTIIDDLPEDAHPDRPWGPDNNPKTAVHAWLADHPEFEIDRAIQDKLQITVAPDGFLKRMR